MTVLDAGQDRVLAAEQAGDGAFFNWLCNYGVAIALVGCAAFWIVAGVSLYFIL